MTMRAYFGWDLERLGTATWTWNDGAARTASIAAGTFAHVDFPLFTAAAYVDFATVWQAALNAVSVGNTITWNPTTMQYTWSRAGAFVITAGTNTVARRISGFSTLPSASLAAHTSHARPWYVVPGEHGGVSDVDPIHERFPHTTKRWSGRRGYAIKAADPPVFQNFTFRLEQKTAAFKDYATAAVPFTWQHAIEHAGAVEPVYLVGDAESVLYELTDRGAIWNPERVKKDWDGRFNVPFDAQRLGKG